MYINVGSLQVIWWNKIKHFQFVDKSLLHLVRGGRPQSNFLQNMCVFTLNLNISKFSPLPNSTPQGIIRTGVGIPSLGFLFRPHRFFIFATLGYYSAPGFRFLSTFAIYYFIICFAPLGFLIPPQLFSSLLPQAVIHSALSFIFFPPRLLFCPRFFTLIIPYSTIPPHRLLSKGRVGANRKC